MVRPLDAGVVVGLATVDQLLNHQVRPQTLFWGGDLAGQGGAAHDLEEHTESSARARGPAALIFRTHDGPL